MLRRVVAASLLVQLSLGISGLVSPHTTAGIAWADPVFEGVGVIELLQPTALVGDGTTAVDLYVLALGPDGKPIAGIKGKPTASAGTTTDLAELGAGLYKFTFTAAKADAKQSVTLSLKTKLPSKEPLARTWTVSVATPTSRQLSVAANPTTITLGQDRTASVSLNLAGGDRQALAGVDVRAAVTVGTLENVTNLGGGQFSALYTAPSTPYPQVLLITAVDKRDPGRTFGSAAVPLQGKADFPVQVGANSRVILKIAGREFGPIQADAQGRARVPIIVPPGAGTATKTEIAADGKVTEEPLDLKIPESRRLAMFPTATAVPADGRLGIPVRVLVVTPDGKPDENAVLAMTATAGSLSQPKHEGAGVYVATFTPPTSNANTQVTLTVTLPSGSTVQSDSTTLNLVPVRPAKVALSSEPATLAATADGFKVFAKVTAPDGQGLGARAVTFNVNGGKVKEVKDLRNGDYQATFATTGTGPVELSASVATASTGNPFAHVLLVPGKDRIANDGVSPLLLTVATVDDYGYPVGNVPVNLRLLGGDGNIPSSATTGADGTVQVYYTAGRKAQAVSIEATANDANAAVTVVQAPTTLALPDLPTSAPKAVATLVDEWAAATAPFRIERDGVTGAVMMPVALPAAAGDRPTKLAISSDPATISAGGTITLKLNLQNAEGRGVGGAQLDFLTSAGVIGAVSDVGNGNYTATLSVPAGTAGEVKVSVATRDGLLSQFMRIPVGGADPGWSAANPFATSGDPYAQQPATTPVAAPPLPAPVTKVEKVKPVKPERTPAPEGEFPWLRVRGGYLISGYSYDQQPLQATTGLFPKPIQLDALSQGFNVNGRVWLPMVKYVGAEVQVKSSRYSLDPAPLCAALGRPCADAALVGDWVTDVRGLVVGRYPFEAGASQFWIGARAGYDLSDVQAIQSKQNSVDLTQVPISSLAVGAELGANIGPKLFFHTDFTEYLAGGTTPFDTTFNVEGGYAFLPNVYFSIAYDLGFRKIAVLDTNNNKIGEVTDVSGVLSSTNDQGTPDTSDDASSKLPVGFTFSLGAQF